MKIIQRLSEDGYIRVGNYTVDTDLLGPGIRFALWLQGCNADCYGCIAPEMQDVKGGSLFSIEKLAEMIISSKNTEGITISGGEPLLQADRLYQLLKIVKTARPDYSVVIYTGFTIDQALTCENNEVSRLINELADVVIDGRYVDEQNDNKGLRGSSNQRIIHITDRYKEHPAYDVNRKRQSRFITNAGRMYMVGVPSRAVQTLLGKIKNKAK
ncbi:MAG: radical SAM protein [Ruminiclostridium sp.]|nr:radical SAM protein [Ruminiclostridium sp.]